MIPDDVQHITFLIPGGLKSTPYGFSRQIWIGISSENQLLANVTLIMTG